MTVEGLTLAQNIAEPTETTDIADMRCAGTELSVNIKK